MSAPIRDDVYWVGVLDWNLRSFQGHRTARGSSYNSYLLNYQVPTLIDAVKEDFVDEWFGRIEEVLPLDQVKQLVCNHAEPDHSSGIPALIDRCPNIEIVCNEKCKKSLSQHYDISNWKFRIIKTGETLSLGGPVLQLLNTPMAHWPESMMSYLPGEKLLFSMDAFGQHYASDGRFDDEVNLQEALQESRIYFGNMASYAQAMGQVLNQAVGLGVEMVAPSHGVIWRSHLQEILDAYASWTSEKPGSKVLVVYDTMWGSTSELARAIAEGVKQTDAEVKLINCEEVHFTDISAELLDSAMLAFGSSTLNRQMLPQIACLLYYIKGLRPKGKQGIAFGSFGWSRGGAEAVEEAMRNARIEIVHPLLSCRYRPDEEILARCREAGKLLGQKAIDLAGIRNR